MVGWGGGVGVGGWWCRGGGDRYVICLYMPYWWGKGWLMVACTFQAPVGLYWMLTIFTEYERIIMWDSVSALIHFPKMFCPQTICAKRRIEHVAAGLLYIRFQYYTKDN